MKVYYSSDDLPVFSKAVVTIGTFDGVHLGHQQILEQLKQEAGRIGGETVIITFHPHPRKVVATNQPIWLINTIEEKIDLLDRKGIDHLVVVPFTPEFSQQTPEDYIEKFLVRKFHPHTIIIGYDHRFGKGRKGDYKLLEALSPQYGYELLEIPGQVINENTVSSTLIREAVLKGDITAANSLLGYDFFFEGLVIDGKKLGRALGYPTANLEIENEEKLVPGNGIYVVQVEHDEKTYGGMMSIGVRPTIGVTERTIEVNIFEFEKEIYGDRLRVHVKKYLREEIKFNNLEELKEQLAADKKDSYDFLTLHNGK
jgi:riboflavin kinase/FMN adenylyltransferase